MAGAFIDLMRSLPLVGILFLMIVMFPLFVPPGVETDKLMRVLVAFTLFNAANFAEVFRGGLQAIPPGQIEAGGSLGLPKWHVTSLIVVPQAIAIAVPGLVNLCIAVIKETTIVLIVGLVDFVGVLQSGMSDPDWLMAPSVRTTAYAFAAAVFWAICFALGTRRSLERSSRVDPVKPRLMPAACSAVIGAGERIAAMKAAASWLPIMQRTKITYRQSAYKDRNRLRRLHNHRSEI